ncbi:MAG: hypothetical protein V4568_13375 [Pseudomonadota bacterium]
MGKTFRYELAGLQRVQDYQLDQLAVALVALKEKLSRQQEMVSEFDAQIAGHESRLTQLIKNQPLFWIEAREATMAYLVELRSKRVLHMGELDRLAEATVRLMAEIVEAQKARRILDKHKGRKFGIHVSTQEKHHASLIDELVLRQSIHNRKNGKKNEN